MKEAAISSLEIYFGSTFNSQNAQCKPITKIFNTRGKMQSVSYNYNKCKMHQMQ